jgi:hypothetical protein
MCWYPPKKIKNKKVQVIKKNLEQTLTIIYVIKRVYIVYTAQQPRRGLWRGSFFWQSSAIKLPRRTLYYCWLDGWLSLPEGCNKSEQQH